MSMYFFKEMEKMKNEILGLGAMVEGELHKAVIAIVERNAELAAEVIAKDNDVDEKEVDIEEELLKIMALNQPVAHDLRFLVATLKINNDMERIGDLAVNIAERAQSLSTKPQIQIPIDLSAMLELAESMVRGSIDALVKLDTDAASNVIQTDDEIDDLCTAYEKTIRKAIAEATTPEAIDALLDIQLVCRDLERIGDHATNIAEDIIYMGKGRIIRHHITEYVEQQANGK